jgi:type I restriction enzyme, S subunit
LVYGGAVRMVDAMQMDLDLSGGSGESLQKFQWNEVTLANAPITIIDGDRGKNYPKQTEFSDSGYCLFLNTGNVTSSGFNFSKCNFISKERDQALGKGRVLENDVVLTTRGTVGNTAWMHQLEPHSAIRINSGMVILRPDVESVDPKFLYFFLRSPKFSRQVSATQSGSAQPQLPIQNLQKLKIPLPPLAEQKRIAAILDKADRIRQKRKETIRLTEELLRSAFLEMFGDPVTNPKGWEVKPLQSFGSIVTGNTPPRDNPENYGSYIEWIKSDNITTPEHFLTSAEEYLSQKGAKLGRIVTKGAVLVTCIAGSPSSIGKAAIADRGVAFNQQINAVIPSDDVSSAFLYAHFLVAQHLIQAQSTNSMKGMVSKGKLSSVEFMKPPKAKQERFDAWFKTFYDLYQRLKKDSLLSENLFNALLQRAFKGQL